MHQLRTENNNCSVEIQAFMKDNLTVEAAVPKRMQLAIKTCRLYFKTSSFFIHDELLAN